jgi:hypothetical protein
MDTWFDTYTDPLEDSYSTYYNQAMLGSLLIYFYYDDSPPEPRNVTNSVNGWFTDLNFVDESQEMFIVIAVMIITIIFLGMKTKQVTPVVLALVGETIIFTLLGFIAWWILLMLALISVIIFYMTAIKGG